MISHADFEDLFPAIFQPSPPTQMSAPAPHQDAAAVLQWADYKTHKTARTPHHSAPGLISHQYGKKLPDPALTLATLAMVPATVVTGAAYAMMAALKQAA